MTKSFQKRIDMQHTSWPALASQDKVRAAIRARIWYGVCRRDRETQEDVQLIRWEILEEDPRFDREEEEETLREHAETLHWEIT